MTSAWDYYTTSHNLLNELRNLTPNYSFSNELLDNAKWRVSNNPESYRTWNHAWLILTKIQDDGLIPTYAQSEAVKPEIWGARFPETDEATQLAACFVYEWETAQTTTGY